MVEIVAAGIAAIGGGLPRRRAAAGDLAIEHGQETFGVGGIASLDDDIEDQAALAGGEVELVSVLHATATFDDDVGVRSNRRPVLAGWDRLALEDPALALGDDARDQRQVMIDLGAPPLGRCPGDLGQPFGDRL